MTNNKKTIYAIACILAFALALGLVAFIYSTCATIDNQNATIDSLKADNDGLSAMIDGLTAKIDTISMEKEERVLQCITVVSDGVGAEHTYSFTKAEWIEYLKLSNGNTCISELDMNMFQYTRTDDIIQFPEELTSYLDSDNERMTQCTTTSISDRYNTVFFGRNDGFLLGYEQNPEWQSVYYVSICVICDEEAEEIIEFEIDGASGAKEIYCEEYCEGIGRNLLAFCKDGNLYVINEALEVYCVTAN